jgi:hypothetical protein
LETIEFALQEVFKKQTNKQKKNKKTHNNSHEPAQNRTSLSCVTAAPDSQRGVVMDAVPEKSPVSSS